jgi:hypothetical protein
MVHRIAFDTKLRRPGCVLIQTALGGDVPQALFASLFPAESWVLAPTPDMQVYEATDDQLARLSELVASPGK